MNDSLVMSRFEAFGNLDEERDRFVDGDRTLRNPLRQDLPLDELHHQELLAFVLFEPMERGDVRMVQLRQELGLPLEPGKALLVLGELLGKDFDCNVSVELGVAGSVDFSIPPAPMAAMIS